MITVQDYSEDPDVDQIDSGADFKTWVTRLLCIQRIIQQYNVSNNYTCILYKITNFGIKLQNSHVKNYKKFVKYLSFLDYWTNNGIEVRNVCNCRAKIKIDNFLHVCKHLQVKGY